MRFLLRQTCGAALAAALAFDSALPARAITGPGDRGAEMAIRTIVFQHEAFCSPLVTAFTGTDGVAPARESSQIRRRAPVRRQPRRRSDGRFVLEWGGSPDDVLRTVWVAHRDDWLLPSHYHEEHPTVVTLDTIKRDFKANWDLGYMERQANAAANGEFEYRLTDLGRTAAEQLDSLDLTLKMTARQRAALFQRFFVLAAPPKWFSRRWFANLFMRRRSQLAAEESLLQLYQGDRPRFEALLREWSMLQPVEQRRQIVTRMLERRSQVWEKLEKPSVEALQQARSNLDDQLSSIEDLRDPRNNLQFMLGNFPFEKWDVDTRENHDDFGGMIAGILDAYGFKNNGDNDYERTSLGYSSWLTAPPACVRNLVASRFPDNSYEMEAARKRLRRVRNAVRDQESLRAVLQGVDLDGLDAMKAAGRILETFGYQERPRSAPGWTKTPVPSLVEDLPEALSRFEEALVERKRAEAENRTAREMMDAMALFLQSITAALPRLSLPAGPDGNGSKALTAVEAAGSTLTRYAAMTDEERGLQICELLVERTQYNRWSPWKRRRLDRLLVELVGFEFSQPEQPGTAGRALMVGQLSPTLAQAIVSVLSRYTMDHVIFTLLGDPRQFALNEMKIQLSRASDLARAQVQAMGRLLPGGAVDPLPEADQRALDEIQKRARIPQTAQERRLEQGGA